MNPSGDCNKAVNFDLVVSALKLHYTPTTGRHYTKAYQDIRNYMGSNGFIHRQGSGYNSVNQLSDLDVGDLVEGIREKLPWVKSCLSEIDITDIGLTHSLMAAIQSDINDNPPINSLKERIANAKAKSEAHITKRKASRKIDREIEL